MRESEILRGVQREASLMNCRLFRNNVGRLQDKNGRYIQFGLCKGSSDLIGWTSTGKFLAVEIKRPKHSLTKQQAQFIAQVNAQGGIAFFVTSIQEFREIMRGLGYG